MHTHRIVALGLVGIVLVAAAAAAGAAEPSSAEWPHWRGPDRTDITPESSRWDEGAWPLGEPA